MTEYQQSVVQEFTECVAQCETLEELMRTGVHLFTISYVDTIIKACWPVFSKRLHEIAPQDRVGGLVIAVDLPAIFHSAFSVSAEDAAQGTLSRIESLIETIKHDQAVAKDPVVIMCCDPETSWRKMECRQFKSKRKPKPDGFHPLLDETKAYLERTGYRVEMIDGMESDDIMASIAFRCKLRRHQCVLVTEDRDMLQCLGSGTSCLGNRSSWKNEEWLLQEMQLTPKQVVDYLCLVGKDDVPSANKIGDINATKLLARCGSYPAILDSMDSLLKAKEVTAKQADSLVEFSTHYQLAKKMHTKLRHLEVNW